MVLTFVIPFCFMLVMSFSMKWVWSLYNLLQIISIIKMFDNLATPGNSYLLLGVLFDTANFSLTNSALR